MTYEALLWVVRGLVLLAVAVALWCLLVPGERRETRWNRERDQ